MKLGRAPTTLSTTVGADGAGLTRRATPRGAASS